MSVAWEGVLRKAAETGEGQRRVKGEQRLQEDPLTGTSAAGSSFSGTGLVFEPPRTYFL